MKVILRHEVESLGDPGEVVVVAAGYARNFLLPRRLALPATPANVRLADSLRKRDEKRKAKELSDAKELGERIERTELSFERLAGENDKLFGSVTASDIAAELAKKGFGIDRRKIQLEASLDRLGVHEVGIKLHAALVATIKVWVSGKPAE